MGLKVGFVGAGMMAEALAGGFDKAGVAAFSDMSCSVHSNQARLDLFASWGAHPCATNAEVAQRSDVIFISVKPYMVAQVLGELRKKKALTKDKLVVSVAAGVTLATMEEAAGPGIPVMRVMPNTPSLVGACAAGMSPGKACNASHSEITARLFNAVGKIHEVKESLLDAVTGVSGSGPAYIFLVIEAMTDGGVLAGLPRPIAQDLAAQTVLVGWTRCDHTSQPPYHHHLHVCARHRPTASHAFLCKWHAHNCRSPECLAVVFGDNDLGERCVRSLQPNTSAQTHVLNAGSACLSLL